METLAEPVKHHNLAENSTYIGVKFNRDKIIDEATLLATLTAIAEKIADKYVADNYQEIVQHLKPEAIASLVSAQVAADIGKTLKEDVHGSVKEVVKTQVFQRGILGGMKRIR